MNDTTPQQRDARTGVPTALHGERSDHHIRSACSALNHSRARGIVEISRFTPQRESLEINVWTATLIEEAKLWGVPIVPLEALGIRRDPEEDEFLISDELHPLTTGAEACPYLDAQNRVVYKLFDLRANGSMGKKVVIQRDEFGVLQAEIKEAVLHDIIKKLSAINDGGGHPTEIVGLVDSFDYLLVKQPLAEPYQDLKSDRQEAMDIMRCVTPMGGHFRHNLAVFHAQGEPWLIGDLHRGNIMRDSEGKPTIIDALIGYLPPYVLKELPWLNIATHDALQFRDTGQAPLRCLFDNINDDDL